jgi:putative PEP-CTERM system TPR-repeat lipoprotein
MKARSLTRRLLRCAAVAATISIAACAPSEQKILERAKAYRDKGDNVAAVLELKTLLKGQPKNPELYFRVGVAMADTGELTSAENALRRARQFGQPAGDVVPVLGRVLLDLEKYPEALTELRTDGAWDPSTKAEVSMLRGRAQAALGQFADAKAEFLGLMEARPAQAKVGLARIALAENDRSGAEKLIEEALARDPKSADALLLRADILRSQSKFEEAAAVYDQLLKFAPRNSRAMLNLAVVLLNRNEIDAAQSMLERGEKIEPASPLLHFAKGLLAFKQKRYDDALRQLRALFETMPKHYPGLMLAGMVNYETAQYVLAQNAFTTYLERYPDDLTARRMLAATLLAKGQPHLAVDVLGSDAGKAADVGFLAVAAEANRRVGRFARAKTLLERAIELDAKNADLRTNLGLIELALGSRQQAIADFDAAIALNPANARADEALIMMLLGQQEVERAQRVADALEQRLPKSPDTYTLKGAILLFKKEEAKARESFERALKLQPAHFPAADALADLDARAGKPDARRRRMEAIIKADPHHLGALLALAKLDLAEGRQAAAVASIRTAIAEHPESINALLMLADVQLRGGDAAQAVISARQAHDQQPFDSRATILLADAQMAAGDKQGAIVTLTSLLDTQPQLVSAYLRLASAYIANDSIKDAESTVVNALKMDPKNLAAKAMLGEIYMRTHRQPNALLLAYEIQKENPKGPLGYRMEGDALLARKDFLPAAAAFQKAAMLEPSGALFIRIHQAQRGAPGGKASDAALRNWLERHPDDVEVRLYLADAMSDAGEYRDAVDQYFEVLKRAPKSDQAQNNLAWALHSIGDDRALQYARKAVELSPKNAATVDTLGWILVNQGKPLEGIPVLLNAVALEAENPEIRFHLAQALLKVGDTARARSELRTLLATGKPFPQRDEAKALQNRLGR